MVLSQQGSRDVRFLFWDYMIHHRLIIVAYLLLLAYHVTIVFFDLQTTSLGISICGVYDCEANPMARGIMEEKGLDGWYHHNISIISYETAVLLGVLITYFVVPARPSRAYLLVQAVFLAAFFYLATVSIVGSVVVAGNFASLRAAVEMLKYSHTL